MSKNNNRVAVIGLSVKFPLNSNSPLEFWNNLLNKNICAINLKERFQIFENDKNNDEFYASILDLEEWNKFDAKQFNIDPTLEHLLDPQIKQLLNCTLSAIGDANIDLENIKKTKTACFIGSTSNDFHNYLRFNKQLKFPVGSTNYSLSNLISYCFDLRGPSYTINSACSSSLISVCQGYEAIINGDCDYSICGGANFIFDKEYHKSYIDMGIVTKGNESKSFNENADGFLRGEGVGVVILKNLEKAIKDNNKIYAVINGSNNNCDGTNFKPAYIYPSKESQLENIQQALIKSNLTINDINYFEASVPGMPFLDQIESEMISMLFREKNSGDAVSIGTYKPNFGHLEGASGIGGLIKCCLMCKFKTFLPTVTFNGNINPNITLFNDESKFKLVKEANKFKKDNINLIINNFGATGSNCCVVLSSFNN